MNTAIVEHEITKKIDAYIQNYYKNRLMVE